MLLQVLVKPDIVGPDGTQTGFGFYGRLSGTLFSASNVAAVAALMLQQDPSLKVSSLPQQACMHYMRTRGEDWGSVGTSQGTNMTMITMLAAWKASTWLIGQKGAESAASTEAN